MEHSGLECAAVKKAKDPPTSGELVLCLRLQGIDEDSSPQEVADELVRCLLSQHSGTLKPTIIMQLLQYTYTYNIRTAGAI